MRFPSAAAVALLIGGCGLDTDPTAPGTAGLAVRELALEPFEPMIAARAERVRALRPWRPAVVVSAVGE